MREIAFWIAEQSKDIEIAKRFVGELRDVCKKLDTFPNAGDIPKDRVIRSAGHRFTVHKEYLIFYLVDETEKQVNVMAIFNEYLMQGCELMSQYAEFVEITRKYALLYDGREEAMNAAIDYCIAHGILEDILRKHRSQILGSLLEDFDEKKYARTLREEGREEGWEAGRESGLRDGRETGLQEGRQEMEEAIARQLNLSVE